jgi:hypothetical protein
LRRPSCWRIMRRPRGRQGGGLVGCAYSYRRSMRVSDPGWPGLESSEAPECESSLWEQDPCPPGTLPGACEDSSPGHTRQPLRVAVSGEGQAQEEEATWRTTMPTVWHCGGVARVAAVVRQVGDLPTTKGHRANGPGCPDYPGGTNRIMLRRRRRHQNPFHSTPLCQPHAVQCR